LWWRILCLNRDQVLDAAEQFTTHLQTFTAALENNDEVTGLAALRTAAQRRNQLDD